MSDLEEELGKIYQLVAELSGMSMRSKMGADNAAQLTANRTVISELKARSDNVKGQATHVGTGFPLRRFNLDIADGRLLSTPLIDEELMI
jgi:hypothetical protein